MSQTTDERLIELAGRCEAAEGSVRWIDGAITEALGLGVCRYPTGDYTASIDAALTLVPEGWVYAFSSNLIGPGNVAGCQRRGDYAASDATAATPALALCAAALRARATGASHEQ